jgi:hypothetical protein
MMGKTSRSDRSQETPETEEEGKTSIFQRLFAPGSVDTSVSSQSNEDDSAGSETNLSTLSGSSGESDDGSSDNSDSEGGLQRFDRELRAKHRGACKNMTVRKTVEI